MNFIKLRAPSHEGGRAVVVGSDGDCDGGRGGDVVAISGDGDPTDGGAVTVRWWWPALEGEGKRDCDGTVL